MQGHGFEHGKLSQRVSSNHFLTDLFPADGAEALDLGRGGDHGSDAAAPHHAGDAAPADPAQLHQPPPGHRPGPGAGGRERGLRGRAGAVRHAG